MMNFGSVVHDDDLVGIVSGPSQGCYNPTGPMGFSLLRDGGNHGWVSLDMRLGDGRDPLCPPTPPPLPAGSVTHSGPSSVRPGSQCRYTGAASGGTGPYTLSWCRNGVFIGPGNDIDVAALSPSFSLYVTAVDATGRSGSSQLQ